MCHGYSDQYIISHVCSYLASIIASLVNCFASAASSASCHSSGSAAVVSQAASGMFLVLSHSREQTNHRLRFLCIERLETKLLPIASRWALSAQRLSPAAAAQSRWQKSLRAQIGALAEYTLRIGLSALDMAPTSGLMLSGLSTN
jgi:hypothetical protein